MSEIVYSIIIPHYNIPNLLARALNSIPQREDVEVIVVDDNSDPSIVDFEHFPGIERPDVKCLFLKQNCGAGVARNTAISLANGKWILCVDADDFLLPDAFSVLDQYVKSESDVVVFKSKGCLSDDVTQRGTRNHADVLNQYIDVCIKDSDKIRELLFSIMSPWCKLVHREFLLSNEIVFGTSMCSEDVIWSVGIAACFQRAEVSDDFIYCVTERCGSLTFDLTLEKIAVWYDVLIARNEYLERRQLLKYKDYFRYEDLLFVRKISSIHYLKLCYNCLRHRLLRPMTMYKFESHLHFKYPYVYLFLGLLNFPQLSNSSFLHKIWRRFL